MQLFVDMDGVLADFDAHYETTFGVRPSTKEDIDWKRVAECREFHLHIPPMADLQRLWDHIERHNPIVLTGAPLSPAEVRVNKRVWVDRHLGEHVEVRCCRASEKSLHASAGDVLIDDWEKYRDLWIAKGGVWVTHRCAEETIEILLELGL